MFRIYFVFADLRYICWAIVWLCRLEIWAILYFLRNVCDFLNSSQISLEYFTQFKPTDASKNILNAMCRAKEFLGA